MCWQDRLARLRNDNWRIVDNFFLQKKTRVRIWLYEDTRLQIEGQIIGFDEYMNMVLEDAVEIDSKKNKTVEVGRILLKGDSITMLQEAQPVRPIVQT